MKEKFIRWLLTLQQHYRRTFNRPDDNSGQRVLADLAKFCDVYGSPFRSDVREMDRMAGRREVFIRISQNLNLDEQELLDLYRLSRDDAPSRTEQS